MKWDCSETEEIDPVCSAPCGAMTGALIGAMTAATGARTDGTAAATGGPDPGCCGANPTPRRTRNPPSDAAGGQRSDARASGVGRD